jgi:hypothetical protein
MTCLKPLDDLLHVPFLTSATSTRPVGINNAFILTKPKHRFLEHVITKRIAQHDRHWPSPWFESMITTGYLFLSNAWMDYVEHHKHPKYEDSVFVLADDKGKYNTHALGGRVETPLFKHEQAKSWHSWDAKFFMFCGKHPKFVGVTLVTMAILFPILILLAICCRRKPVPCTPAWRRARKARRDEVVEARRNRAIAIQEREQRVHNASTANGAAIETISDRNAMLLRLLTAMATPPPPSPQQQQQQQQQQEPVPFARRGRRSIDSISPIVLPARRDVSVGSYNSPIRTSSMMPPAHGISRPSIYDFAPQNKARDVSPAPSANFG